MRRSATLLTDDPTADVRVPGDGKAPGPAPSQGPPPPTFARTLPAQLGRYTLTMHLGTGGMAEVFLARYVGPGGFEKSVVVKVLLPHLAHSPKYVALFQREANIVARLRHPNVVQVLEFVSDGEVPYIVMEYIDGIALNRLARRAWAHKHSVPLELCVNAIADAALGLSYAHREGMIHRDISPDNLMITKEGVTMVLDFGIAKATDSETVTKTGEVKGKIPFMAPEIIRGEVPTAAVDIYALGVTFYWLVTGQRPFRGNEAATLHAALTQEPPSPRSLNPTLPWKVEALILAMLAKDPKQRVGSADEVHKALDFAAFARHKIVVPFVAQMLALDDQSPADGPTTDGFLPSQPSLDLAKAMELSSNDVPFRSAPPDAAPQPGTLAPLDTAITGRHDSPHAARARAPLRAALVGGGALAAVAVLAWSLRAPSAPDAPPTPAPALAVAPPASAAPPSPPPAPIPVAPPVSSPPSTEPATPLPSAADPPAKKKSEARAPAVKGKGKLQIRAFPFAEVFVDKKRIGVTPFPDVELPAGTHAITLKFEKKIEKRTVRIRPNETERITVRFE